jgi:hypothetical protein
MGPVTSLTSAPIDHHGRGSAENLIGCRVQCALSRKGWRALASTILPHGAQNIAAGRHPNSDWLLAGRDVQRSRRHLLAEGRSSDRRENWIDCRAHARTRTGKPRRAAVLAAASAISATRELQPNSSRAQCAQNLRYSPLPQRLRLRRDCARDGATSPRSGFQSQNSQAAESTVSPLAGRCDNPQHHLCGGMCDGRRGAMAGSCAGGLRVQVGPQLVPRDAGFALHIKHALGRDPFLFPSQHRAFVHAEARSQVFQRHFGFVGQSELAKGA